MPSESIRVADLEKTYAEGENLLTVFSGVNIEFRRGESAALVGESGAGKSTLLHLLGALDRPTAGDIYVGERAISTFSGDQLADYRNRSVGYVWQNYHLLPEFTALENAMMPLLIGGASPDVASAAARRWLNRVGLAERTQHRAGELSGGEQQRVAIARSLVTEPVLLLADEPTGNLDFRTGEAIIELILNLPKNHNVAVVVATHNLSFAERCDRVYRIHQARVLDGRGPIPS
jgi:lipoprotein-releasing system ATP-binding protein